MWPQEMLSILTKGSRWFIGPTEALCKPGRVSEGPRGAGSFSNVNLTVEGGQKREAQAQGGVGGYLSLVLHSLRKVERRGSSRTQNLGERTAAE